MNGAAEVGGGFGGGGSSSSAAGNDYNFYSLIRQRMNWKKINFMRPLNGQIIVSVVRIIEIGLRSKLLPWSCPLSNHGRLVAAT